MIRSQQILVQLLLLWLQVVEKFQHIALDTGAVQDQAVEAESGCASVGSLAQHSRKLTVCCRACPVLLLTFRRRPGNLPDWEFVNARMVYHEYLQSPYHNVKSSGL